MSSHRRIAALIGVIAIVAAACGGAASPSPSAAAPSAAATRPPRQRRRRRDAEPVTIEWWHITTGDPGKSVFQGIADAYTAAHPNVKINITILENEAFKTKLATSLQSGDVPDLFQSWGGGIMAAQADAGALKDITADIASWKDTINPGALSIYSYKGVQYGVPWDMGMIGVWYNKALFTKAGITRPAGDLGRVPRRRRQAQGRRHRPARHRRQGHVAVDAPLDVPRAPHRRWR